MAKIKIYDEDELETEAAKAKIALDEINDYINDLEEKIDAVIKYLSIRHGLELVRTVEDDEIKLSPIFPGV